MRLSLFTVILAMLALTGCTTEKAKPQNNWEVTVKKESDNRVWIAKADGSKQCEGPSTLTPKAAAEELKKAGVVVYNARAGNDGMMHITKCGSPTGKTVELEISELDLSRTKALGYRVKTM